MTAEQGGPLDRLFSGLRRWWAENVVDWEPQPEIGSDDEWQGNCTDPHCMCGNQLYDDESPCLDPNLHYAATGCETCWRTLEAIRDRIICQEILWLGTKEPTR